MEEKQKDYVLVRVPRYDYDRIRKAGFKPSEYIRVLINSKLSEIEAKNKEA